MPVNIAFEEGTPEGAPPATQDALGRHVATIDGITYRATAWPATPALKMAYRLAQTFGQAALALLQVSWGAYGAAPAAEVAPGQPNGKDEALDKGGLLGGPSGPVASAKAGSLLMLAAAERDISEEACSKLFVDVFERVTCDQLRIGEVITKGNVAKQFDEHFKGRMPHLFEVFSWVVRVSFTLPGGAS